MKLLKQAESKKFHVCGRVRYNENMDKSEKISIENLYFRMDWSNYFAYKKYPNGAYPYLGGFDNEYNCCNVSELPQGTKFIRISPNSKQKCTIYHLLRGNTEIEGAEIGKIDDDILSVLESLPNLKYLKLSFARQPYLPSLSNLQSLEVLILYACKQISSLDFLGDIPNLESLCVSELILVNDLTPLKRLSSLKELWMDGAIASPAGKVKTLEPIRFLTNLEFLHFMLSVEKEALSVEPLTSLLKLKYILLNKRFNRCDCEKLLEAAPQLSDIYFGNASSWNEMHSFK